MKMPTMKKLGTLILISMTTFYCAAQSNVIYGDLFSFDLKPRTNLTMTLTLVSPVNRVWDGKLISNDPRTVKTDTLGHFNYTNVIYGKYRLQPSDDSQTIWTLYVGTNTVGLWNYASLITNSAAIPPNDGTNFPTTSQVIAMIGTITSESQTNLLWGTNLTENTEARPAFLYYVFSNGIPQWGTISTNHP